MIKVMSVFGSKPEAIKMAPVVKELEKRSGIESVVCVTAQRRQTLDQVLKAFRIRPDYDLNIMKFGLTLSDFTAAVLHGTESVIRNAKPDIVLVHGGTDTAFAAALAAFYQQVPIGHVEAGLRTYDKSGPFPEEMNRQMADRMADLLFAPTELNRKNLLRENIPEEQIFVTGNTAIDALETTVRIGYFHPDIDWVKEGERLILLTSRYRENPEEPMENVFRAVRRVTEDCPDVKVICPIRMNSAVGAIAGELLSGCDRIRLIEPLEVFDFHNFIDRSDLVLTDSGGIQEEAPSLGKPVLVLRDTTDRPEGVSAGTLKLVGTREEDIYRETVKLLTDRKEYEKMSLASNPYGDGHASKRIVDAIQAAVTDKAGSVA